MHEAMTLSMSACHVQAAAGDELLSRLKNAEEVGALATEIKRLHQAGQPFDKIARLLDAAEIPARSEFAAWAAASVQKLSEAGPDPSPDEIRAACRAIQASWSIRERIQREIASGLVCPDIYIERDTEAQRIEKNRKSRTAYASRKEVAA